MRAANAPPRTGRAITADPREERQVTATASREVPAGQASKRREHIPLGILHMAGATMVFSISSASSKWLVATYPVGEVLFTRSLVSLIACAAFILPATGLAVFRTGRLRHHVMRSFSQACSQTFLITAFSLMPLAGAIAINFSAPLFTALVSIVLLKEKVGLARWSALLIGFLGVLIVTNPGAETFQIGALFALSNAILYGTVTAAVRGMTATESTETLTLYQLLLITGFFALVAPFGFIMPSWSDAGLILFNGLSNAVGQYWWTKSLHLGPASAIAPFFYLSLVWAVVLGYLVWGDVPTLGLLAGSAIVVASGLFLLWRESRRM
jgi:drug/metabolite transporter (DMT)-like permease